MEYCTLVLKIIDLYLLGHLQAKKPNGRLKNIEEEKTHSSLVYVSESPPLTLSIGKHLMALLENGMIAFWDTKTPSVKSPVGIIELNIQDGTGSNGFLSTCFAADDRNIFFSYGSLLEPLIEKFTYLSNDDQIKSHVVLTRLLQKVEKKQKVFKVFFKY
jgi:hypothetical protein